METNGQSAAKEYKAVKPLENNSIYNKVKVLSFAYAVNSRAFYNTTCLECGTLSIRRVDHIKTYPEFCNACKEVRTAKPKVESVLTAIFGGYRSNAKAKGKEFSLTKEQFQKLITQNCFYCNAEPTETQTSKSRNRTVTKFLHNGVDRKDSDLGYTEENCVACCSMCNLMKNKFNLVDFVNKINQIHAFYIKSSTTMPQGSTLQANGNGNGRGPEMDHDIV
jgi:hypothetical protein